VRIPKIITVVLLAACIGHADTIFLKNGHKIVADCTRDKGDQLEYQLGDSTMSIPKSMVLRVQAGAESILSQEAPKCPKSYAETMVAHSESGHSTGRVPLPLDVLCKQFGPQRTKAEDFMVRCERVLRGGGVDQEALAAVEMECNPQITADTYFTAAKFDQSGNNNEGALDYLLAALRYKPEHEDALLMIIDVLEQLQRYREEVAFAERTVRVMGSDQLLRLGRAYYLTGNKDEAIRVWKVYCGLHPRSSVQQLIYSAESTLAADRNRRTYPNYPYPNYPYGQNPVDPDP
jgi:hypothetical protein